MPSAVVASAIARPERAGKSRQGVERLREKLETKKAIMAAKSKLGDKPPSAS